MDEQQEAAGFQPVRSVTTKSMSAAIDVIERGLAAERARREQIEAAARVVATQASSHQHTFGFVLVPAAALEALRRALEEGT